MNDDKVIAKEMNAIQKSNLLTLLAALKESGLGGSEALYNTYLAHVMWEIECRKRDEPGEDVCPCPMCNLTEAEHYPDPDKVT